MVAALDFGHQALQPLIDVQERMAAEIGKPKRAYTPFGLADVMLASRSYEKTAPRLHAIFDQPHGQGRDATQAIDALEAKIGGRASRCRTRDWSTKLAEAFEETLKKVVRQRILEQGMRPDGRDLTDIRPIWCEVGISPRAAWLRPVHPR